MVSRKSRKRSVGLFLFYWEHIGQYIKDLFKEPSRFEQNGQEVE